MGASGGVNYVTVEGFTDPKLQDFTSTNDVPAGVLIVGSGTGINVLDNTVKNIQSTAKRQERATRTASASSVPAARRSA